MKLHKALLPIGLFLIMLGGVRLLFSPRQASTHADYSGWGEVLVGALALVAYVYFERAKKQREDREEARRVHDARHKGDDLR